MALQRAGENRFQLQVGFWCERHVVPKAHSQRIVSRLASRLAKKAERRTMQLSRRMGLHGSTESHQLTAGGFFIVTDS